MFDEIAGVVMTFLGSKPTLRQKLALVSVIIGSLTFIFSFKIVSAYLNSPRPVIEIVNPTSGSEIAESETILHGRVSPADSKVTVNGRSAIQNGDGNFSQSIELSEGKNTIKIEAQYFGKKSGLLYRAIRVLSEAEINERNLALEKESRKVKESAEKIAAAEVEQSVLGAEIDYDQSIISDHVLVSDRSGKIISGNIENTTSDTLGWIKIYVEFKDEVGEIVDSKEAYATQTDQYLAPAAKIPFTVPATDKHFATYEIKVVYDAM